MPNIVGATLSNANKTLQKMGLDLGSVSPSDADDSSVVIGQSVDPDENVAKGTSIDLELRKADSTSEPDNNPDNNQTTPEPDNKVTSKVITVMIPQSEDTTNVRVVQDGTTIHDQTHSKREGSVDVTVTGSGTARVDIYYNGVYNSTVTVEL